MEIGRILTLHLLMGKALKKQGHILFLLVRYKSQSRPILHPAVTPVLFPTISLNSKTVGAFEVDQKFQNMTFLNAWKLHDIISFLSLNLM